MASPFLYEANPHTYAEATVDPKGDYDGDAFDDVLMRRRRFATPHGCGLNWQAHRGGVHPCLQTDCDMGLVGMTGGMVHEVQAVA